MDLTNEINEFNSLIKLIEESKDYKELLNSNPLLNIWQRQVIFNSKEEVIQQLKIAKDLFCLSKLLL